VEEGKITIEEGMTIGVVDSSRHAKIMGISEYPVVYV
jgi:hypothetical protein